MRWTRVARLTSAYPCGRRSRVVLTPRRWRQVLEKQSFSGMMVAKKPGHQGEHEISCNTIACGNAGCPGATVVTNACAFYLCARGCGCIGYPAFPAPSISGRKIYAKLGRTARRDRETVSGDDELRGIRQAAVGSAKRSAPTNITKRWHGTAPLPADCPRNLNRGSMRRFRGEDFDRCRAATDNESTAGPASDDGHIAIFAAASTPGRRDNMLALGGKMVFAARFRNSQYATIGFVFELCAVPDQTPFGRDRRHRGCQPAVRRRVSRAPICRCKACGRAIPRSRRYDPNGVNFSEKRAPAGRRFSSVMVAECSSAIR
jgi:hypothetical protein